MLLGEPEQRLDLALPDLDEVVVALALGLGSDWLADSRRSWISCWNSLMEPPSHRRGLQRPPEKAGHQCTCAFCTRGSGRGNPVSVTDVARFARRPRCRR